MKVKASYTVGLQVCKSWLPCGYGIEMAPALGELEPEGYWDFNKGPSMVTTSSTMSTLHVALLSFIAMLAQVGMRRFNLESDFYLQGLLWPCSLDLTVSMNRGPFCGCPYSRSCYLGSVFRSFF